MSEHSHRLIPAQALHLPLKEKRYRYSWKVAGPEGLITFLVPGPDFSRVEKSKAMAASPMNIHRR
jgi:hypothetical protein